MQHGQDKEATNKKDLIKRKCKEWHDKETYLCCLNSVIYNGYYSGP
jgi:hypothetical protein